MPARKAELSQIHQSFTQALDSLIERVKLDRSVLAVILCGSLSHDTVWAKSDIDLVLVTIDDKKTEPTHLALYAGGVNVHAMLIPRAEFRKSAESAIHNSFLHSFLAKGRLLYTHDDTIAALLDRLLTIGQRDTRIQMLSAGAAALLPLYKAHKWMLTRRDLEYAALWILYTATPLAKLEILSAGLLADREVLPQAIQLKPDFFRAIYADLLNQKKSARAVQAALDAVDAYLAARAPRCFAPVIDHLREAGEARSATEIDDHFHRNYGIEGVTQVCEYLADRGLLGKVPLSVRLTRRSNLEVEELAFISLEPPAE